jgi:hypothetical protein
MSVMTSPQFHVWLMLVASSVLAWALDYQQARLLLSGASIGFSLALLVP